MYCLELYIKKESLHCSSRVFYIGMTLPITVSDSLKSLLANFPIFPLLLLLFFPAEVFPASICRNPNEWMDKGKSPGHGASDVTGLWRQAGPDHKLDSFPLPYFMILLACRGGQSSKDDSQSWAIQSWLGSIHHWLRELIRVTSGKKFIRWPTNREQHEITRWHEITKGKRPRNRKRSQHREWCDRRNFWKEEQTQAPLPARKTGLRARKAHLPKTQPEVVAGSQRPTRLCPNFAGPLQELILTC